MTRSGPEGASRRPGGSSRSTGVAHIADMLEYQEGSIVSRTVLKAESGSITVFAFDQSQGLSEHTTPHEALIYLVDGEAEVTIDGQARLVKRGEMIVLPANRPHAVKAISRFKMILTMLKS